MDLGHAKNKKKKKKGKKRPKIWALLMQAFEMVINKVFFFFG